MNDEWKRFEVVLHIVGTTQFILHHTSCNVNPNIYSTKQPVVHRTMQHNTYSTMNPNAHSPYTHVMYPPHSPYVGHQAEIITPSSAVLTVPASNFLYITLYTFIVFVL